MDRLPNKLVVSGKSIETYSYEKPLLRNCALGRKNYNKRTYRNNGCFNHTTPLIRNKNSLQRSRSQINRLVNANPDLVKYMTITFRDKMSDAGMANYEFNKFIQRLRYLNKGNLKYIAVPELQKRGAVHYHLLSNMGYINQTKLNSVWPHGFAKIKNVYNILNAGFYISKHLKENSDNSYLFGRRSYFASRNINRPLVYTSYIQNSSDLSEAWEGLKLYDLSPVYQKIYNSKYQGKVLYKQYKLKTCKITESLPD